ncbi:coenzyme A biosynthesis bifunctional protein CoaBC [bacterium BMS3Bbin14]|nr:coenzyme A biosynthesis bifunctional protein CoaBC [bacterium BMS3Abin13]GBE53219.1 coenzyme A biosynthesis bifunctional protein CoaBC [bacterium BMS3Bbin14]HDO30232.1 bifunctional phosphopantothenoylcysteine decarboxylase/phosphopantothenate--cysteine ligase CoaBC [Desulfobacteraceae bacterium]
MQGRKILFGVTGGIAAFKAAQWVRFLVKEEARVTVVMTRAATRFVSKLSFTALSGRPAYVELFSDDPRQVMSHITLAAEADALLIAPATAHTIARLAHGLADDLLTTTVLAAAGKPVVVCPAMNSGMFTHPATQDNLRRLRELGYVVVEPDSGVLACGAEGPGRLPEWDGVRETLLSCFAPDDLRNQHILVTAGPTREPLDPARYLSNRSSGKMGYALARTARRRGAQVSLVSGPVALEPPPGVELFRVNTAREMHEQVMRLRDRASIIIKAAAVADFRPARSEPRKIKKSTGTQAIDLVANVDILAELGRKRRPGQILVGFAAESHDHESEGTRKLHDKNLDLIVVNDICGRETGFDADTNQVTLIDKSGSSTLPLLSKEQTAERIWDHVVSLLNE